MMKTDFRVNVFPLICEDGSVEWGATFPDVRNIVGGGSTPEEAVKEAYENLSVYLEEVGEKNAPKASNPEMDSYSGRFVLRTTKSLHKRLVMMAEDERVSLNALCNEALALYVGAEGIEKAKTKKQEYNNINCFMMVLDDKNFRRV